MPRIIPADHIVEVSFRVSPLKFGTIQKSLPSLRRRLAAEWPVEEVRFFARNPFPLQDAATWTLQYHHEIEIVVLLGKAVASGAAAQIGKEVYVWLKEKMAGKKKKRPRPKPRTKPKKQRTKPRNRRK